MSRSHHTPATSRVKSFVMLCLCVPLARPVSWRVCVSRCNNTQNGIFARKIPFFVNSLRVKVCGLTRSYLGPCARYKPPPTPLKGMDLERPPALGFGFIKQHNVGPSATVRLIFYGFLEVSPVGVLPAYLLAADSRNGLTLRTPCVRRGRKPRQCAPCL